MGQRLNVVDTSGLTDADWAAVNRVNRAYETGGLEAFWDELENLDDPGPGNHGGLGVFPGFDPRSN